MRVGAEDDNGRVFNTTIRRGEMKLPVGWVMVRTYWTGYQAFGPGGAKTATYKVREDAVRSAIEIEFGVLWEHMYE
jgi:hypothetical protein